MTAAALLGDLRARGYRAHLRPDGGVRIVPTPPADLLAELRQHRDEIAAALRVELAPPPPLPAVEVEQVEADGELRACQREANDLHRLRTGLGDEIDVLLWSVLGRLDRPRAERCWHHVQRALADGLLSRLVGWARSLANANAEQVDVLLAGGPRAHSCHDATSRADT